MAAPPSLEGALKVIETEPLPAVAVPMVGAPGTAKLKDETVSTIPDEPAW